jgi:hypothetical protein
MKLKELLNQDELFEVDCDFVLVGVVGGRPECCKSPSVTTKLDNFPSYFGSPFENFSYVIIGGAIFDVKSFIKKKSCYFRDYIFFHGEMTTMLVQFLVPGLLRSTYACLVEINDGNRLTDNTERYIDGGDVCRPITVEKAKILFGDDWENVEVIEKKDFFKQI